MLVYHGSNKELAKLVVGSWVTADLDVAWEFAQQKVENKGGEAVVMAVEIEEDDISWDVISLSAGVDDERGELTRSLPAHVISHYELSGPKFG